MKLFYPSTFYSNIYVDIPELLMKYVIGKKGRCFKEIGEKCNVHYIWYNKKRGIVQIWGPIGNIMSAHYCVLSRIAFVKNQFSLDIPQEENNEQITHWKPDDLFEMELFDKLEECNVKFLIGKKGSFFKNLTKETGVSFIWYNPQNHSLQVWGTKEDFELVKTSILQKISEISTLIHDVNSEVEDTNV